MSRWTQSVTIEPLEFDGDILIFTLNRLEVQDMLELSKHMTQETGGSLKLSFADSIELVGVASKILPKYIVSIKGFLLNGMEADRETFLATISNQFYFTELFSYILSNLFDISVVHEGDEKNLETPQ